jgi:SAM-dependent methyltransferase
MSAPDWPVGVPTGHDPDTWFEEHFAAADEIVGFLRADGIDLAGKVVADVGCGDGIIDLGVVQKGRPATLTGYDVRPTDVEALRATARRQGVEFPPDQQLNFVRSEETQVPAQNDFYDVVFSWSTFEHVSDPPTMLREICRIMKPEGYFLLQVWPLFQSFHGGHLWLSVQQPFAHLTTPPHELEPLLDGRPATDPTRSATEEFRSLNRVTLDDLQRGLLAAGMRPVKVKPIAETFHMPASVRHLPLSLLSISGIQLVAVRA